jgi:hypothetical protein
VEGDFMTQNGRRFLLPRDFFAGRFVCPPEYQRTLAAHLPGLGRANPYDKDPMSASASFPPYAQPEWLHTQYAVALLSGQRELLLNCLLTE